LKVIYGSYFSGEDIKKIIPSHVIAKKLLSEEGVGLVELTRKILGSDFDVFSSSYYNHPGPSVILVGREWNNIGNKETGKVFKDSVQKALNKLFKKNITCRTISIQNIEKEYYEYDD
jgi:hypothetical protein